MDPEVRASGTFLDNAALAIMLRMGKPLARPLVLKHSKEALYPVHGMRYFATHPILWGSLIAMLIPQTLLTIVVFTLAYAFLYPIQAAVAFLFNGPVGLVTAWVAIIQQAVSITQMCSALILMPTPMRVLFDTVMTIEGHDRLVLEEKLRGKETKSNSSRMTNYLIKLPTKIIVPFWIVQILFRMAVNMVPFVGPVALIALDANTVAERCHSRYFQLKGWDQPEVKNYVLVHRAQYFAFGMLAATLESLPLIGVAFMFTNTVGGALWARDLEEQNVPARARAKRSSTMHQFVTSRHQDDV